MTCPQRSSCLSQSNSMDSNSTTTSASSTSTAQLNGNEMASQGTGNDHASSTTDVLKLLEGSPATSSVQLPREMTIQPFPDNLEVLDSLEPPLEPPQDIISRPSPLSPIDSLCDLADGNGRTTHHTHQMEDVEYDRLTPEGESVPSCPQVDPTVHDIQAERASLVSPMFAYWEILKLMEEAKSFKVGTETYDPNLSSSDSPDPS